MARKKAMSEPQEEQARDADVPVEDAGGMSAAPDPMEGMPDSDAAPGMEDGGPVQAGEFPAGGDMPFDCHRQ